MLNKKTIVVDKYQMTYLESETKSGTLTPVLFLHGWALSPQSFQPGLELISNQRKVIAPDIFSFKKANNSHDKWKYEDYAEALSNLLDVLQIKEVHIMGHSLGGGISIVFSAIYPSKVQSIVLIDSTGIPLGNFLKVLGGRFI
jgi:pimeloyl-ACP methyl ester carboxylesterase